MSTPNYFDGINPTEALMKTENDAFQNTQTNLRKIIGLMASQLNRAHLNTGSHAAAEQLTLDMLNQLESGTALMPQVVSGAMRPGPHGTPMMTAQMSEAERLGLELMRIAPGNTGAALELIERTLTVPFGSLEEATALMGAVGRTPSPSTMVAFVTQKADDIATRGDEIHRIGGTTPDNKPKLGLKSTSTAQSAGEGDRQALRSLVRELFVGTTASTARLSTHDELTAGLERVRVLRTNASDAKVRFDELSATIEARFGITRTPGRSDQQFADDAYNSVVSLTTPPAGAMRTGQSLSPSHPRWGGMQPWDLDGLVDNLVTWFGRITNPDRDTTSMAEFVKELYDSVANGSIAEIEKLSGLKYDPARESIEDFVKRALKNIEYLQLNKFLNAAETANIVRPKTGNRPVDPDEYSKHILELLKEGLAGRKLIDRVLQGKVTIEDFWTLEERIEAAAKYTRGGPMRVPRKL